MSMARDVWRRARSILLWLAIVLLTVFFSLLIILCSLLAGWADRRRRARHWLASAWGQSIFWCNPGWRVTVRGRHHLRPDTCYVLVSNHQSLFDIMALCYVRRQFKWVAKRSLFAIPFAGWSMRLAGYIPLERGRQSSIRETYRTAERWLRAGISVFFFPEGTRSHTGELGPFKNGAFKLALDTYTAVAPIAVHGTRELLSRGDWVFRGRGRVSIVVHPPLDPAVYRQTGPSKLRDDAHRAIRETLNQL